MLNFIDGDSVLAMLFNMSKVNQSKLIGVFITLILSGCASTPNVPTGDVSNAEIKTVPIEERAVVDGEALPLPRDPVLTTEVLPEASPASPVVKRLMASSQQQRKIKNWDGASGSLERALRLEPRNPYLWSALAEVKFEQGAWKKSIQLAAKSNTLSGNDVQLRRSNWNLMANAHKSLGNDAAAEKFMEKLTR